LRGCSGWWGRVVRVRGAGVDAAREVEGAVGLDAVGDGDYGDLGIC
jgi:hypothetical protein